MTRVRRVTMLALLVGALTIGATVPADAAAGWEQDGRPGAVYEASTPGWCKATADHRNTWLYVEAAGPTVYASRLPNGSTSQWVRWEVVFFNATTGQFISQKGSDWVWATTSSPARMPTLADWAPYGHRIVAIAGIRWWDPVSRQYSAGAEYTINRYVHSGVQGYSDAYRTYQSC